MYRVRLASGEETAFRSVEELALGIQSGVITVDAEVYHADVQRWLPISVHPEYMVAAEQVSRQAQLSVADPALAVPDADVEVLLQGKVPIYKMVSVSARELEARRRPQWIAVATTGGAAVIFLGAIVVASALGGGSADVAWTRPGVASTGKRIPAVNVPSPTTGSPRSGQPGPGALAHRAATAGADVARILGEAANRLGVNRLVSPRRLASPDSLRAVRQAVASFRPAIAQWRDAEAGVLSAYRDTAAALARSGRWDRSELTEWRVRAPGGEALSTTRATDSLLLMLDRGYALLQESDRVDSTGSPRFGQAEVAAEYDRIRAMVVRLVAEPAVRGGRVPPPLVILRSALDGKTFPASTTR